MSFKQVFKYLKNNNSVILFVVCVKNYITYDMCGSSAMFQVGEIPLAVAPLKVILLVQL